MTRDLFYSAYIGIGFLYWAINVFVRKLPDKNDDSDGWIMTPVWIFFWPLCFITLIIAGLQALWERRKL